MDISEIIVEVRDSSLNRVGQILPNYLVGLEAVLRHNKVGAWKIELPASHPMVDFLREPGSGIIVTTSQGVLISGPTTKSTLTQESNDPEGYWSIEGVDDSVILVERLAYPDPTTDDVALQGFAYDTRTGPAETVVKDYVNANIGPSAPLSRVVSGLTIEADSALGDTVTGSARFETLASLCSSLLTTSNLGFNILQNGTGLVFEVYQPVDRSAEIRMDVFNARLDKSEYSYTRPGATRVIVAGQGTGIDRTFLERSSTESTTAEATWNRRIEVFKDQRNTNDTTELQQAGDEILVEQGATVEAVSFSPSDDITMRFGIDWGLGDTVTAVAGDVEVSRVVKEVAIVVTDSGVKIGATVGNTDAAASKDDVSVLASNQSNQEERISNLERNDTAAAGGGGGGAADYTSIVKHEVKLAQSISKGQAVYVSSANGTNMIVSKASNAAESTSSKTMGLLETSGATNAFVNVIAEGLLTGSGAAPLDTSTATAGDPVWLGTSGNLIYGLASKPSAPAHLVFIGIVTRSNNVNGEIFVRPQNGFELDELHDVSIVSKANNNVLAYDSATGLWKNKTAAATGLVTTSDVIDVAHGGTNATTASTARTNLGAVGVYAQTTEPTGGNVGDIWVDTSSDVNAWSSFMPYAMSSGSTTITTVANVPVSVTVTFPTGRFTQAPNCLATGNTASSAFVYAATGGATTTSFTVTALRGNAVTMSVDWVAIQMLPTSASG